MGDVNIQAPLLTENSFNSLPSNILKQHIATIEPDSQTLIAQVCDEIKALLLEKNRKYGDSALNPTRIFAKSDSVEQIKVRIDDKLNRLKNAQGDEDEDVVLDLIGYLVLLRVAQRKADSAKNEPQKGMDFSMEITHPHSAFEFQPLHSPHFMPPVRWDSPTSTWKLGDAPDA